MNSILTMAITALVFALLFKVARREKAAAIGDGESLLFCYVSWFKISGVILLIVGALLAANAVLSEGPFAGACYFFAPLVLLIGGAIYWESRFTLIVTPTGWDCRSPYKKSRFLAWVDIAVMTYSPGMMWFRIQATDGYVFHVPALIKGMPQLLDACAHHLRPEIFQTAKAAYEAQSAELTNSGDKQ